MRAPLSLRGAARLAVLACVLLAMAVAGLTRGNGETQRHSADPLGADRQLPIALRLIVYRLDQVRPTVFRFSQPVREARIITQPILAPGSASRGEKWIYAVRAEMLDEFGGLLEARTFHARSLLIEASGKRRGPVRYFRSGPELIAPADEIRVAAERPFAAMRLTTALLARDMVAVDVRVSEQRPLIASAAATAFQRLSPGDRRRLAAPNAFPPELLTPAERSAIAVNQWRPVGPVGIDGRDYRMGVLYEQEDPGGDLGDGGDAPAEAEAGG